MCQLKRCISVQGRGRTFDRYADWEEEEIKGESFADIGLGFNRGRIWAKRFAGLSSLGQGLFWLVIVSVLVLWSGPKKSCLTWQAFYYYSDCSCLGCHCILGWSVFGSCNTQWLTFTGMVGGLRVSLRSSEGDTLNTDSEISQWLASMPPPSLKGKEMKLTCTHGEVNKSPETKDIEGSMLLPALGS